MDEYFKNYKNLPSWNTSSQTCRRENGYGEKMFLQRNTIYMSKAKRVQYKNKVDLLCPFDKSRRYLTHFAFLMIGGFSPHLEKPCRGFGVEITQETINDFFLYSRKIILNIIFKAKKKQAGS